MKLIPTFSVILIFIVLTGSHCKKHNRIEPVLPQETQTGANTFGCRINDTIYLAKATVPTCTAYDVQYYKGTGTLLIKTHNTCAKGLNIYLYNIFTNGDYQIFNPANNAYVYSLNSNSNCNGYDRYNSIQTGTVAITKLDTLTKVVSGRFYGDLKISGCPDIIITDGRFDFTMDIFN